jgi:hypothetical protein
VTTVVVDAISYLFSAMGIRAIGGEEPPPARADAPRLRVGDLLDGWRYILAHPTLRPLFFNTALACVGGLIGSRLARPLEPTASLERYLHGRSPATSLLLP